MLESIFSVVGIEGCGQCRCQDLHELSRQTLRDASKKVGIRFLKKKRNLLKIIKLKMISNFLSLYERNFYGSNEKTIV